MCVANLNLTTSPCSHRWYQLIRPCEPTNDLSNCPQKLRLEGWESRVDHCPFCTSTSTSTSTHRLFGSTSSASSSISSPTDPLAMTLRRGSSSTRQGSIATLPSGASTPLSPLSRQSSGGSANYFLHNTTSDYDRAQRSRDMNDRVLMYLSSEPHQVLPSGRKYYPTYANVEEEGGMTTTTTTAASSISDGNASSGGMGRTKERIGRGWKRMSGRFMLKGV